MAFSNIPVRKSVGCLQILKQLSVRVIWVRARARGHTKISAAGSRHASNIICQFNSRGDEEKESFLWLVSCSFSDLFSMVDP